MRRNIKLSYAANQIPTASAAVRTLTMLPTLAIVAMMLTAGAAAPTLKDGVLYGQVVDDVTGKPVPGAVVSMHSDNGKVIAWTKTDDQGRYAISADPVKALHLKVSHHHTLLSQIAGGVGTVVMLPVKVVGTAAKVGVGLVKETVITSPGATAQSVVSSVATGTPVPAVSKVLENTVKASAQQIPSETRQQSVQSVFDSTTHHHAKDPTAQSGSAIVTVSASNYQDLKGQVGSYWMAAPTVTQGQEIGPRAWVETVKLAPTGSNKKSEVATMSVSLADAAADPRQATPGSKVHISVKVQKPDDVPADVRVFARENRTHALCELKPDKNGVYAGDMTLDPKMPIGDSAIAVAAFHSEPVDINIKKGKDDPMLAFAARTEALEAGKPYEFDPRILASENRMDIALTVLDPKAASAPAPITPKSPAASGSSPAKPSAPAPANPPAPTNPQAPANPPAPGTPPAPANPPKK